MDAHNKYRVTLIFLLIAILSCKTETIIAQSKYGPNDTIFTTAAIYEGDTIEAHLLARVYVWGKGNMTAKERWTRLRTAVYVT